MCKTKSVKKLVQGDEKDDDQFFLDTLFIGNTEKADKLHAVIRSNETREQPPMWCRWEHYEKPHQDRR